nr:hypothetical protein [Tanacetum cinerariifolium]
MQEVFKQMEAEVDQHAIDKKCDEIEQKNLIIKNENLIVDCLSKDVFYTKTDYVLNVSRFSNMHEEFNAAQKRITKLESENSNLKNKIRNDDHDASINENHKSNCVTMLAVKSKVFALGTYVIDVEPIPPRFKNNREVHLDYLKYLKESVATLREIVEEARVEKPLDSSLASACLYTKHSHELVEYVTGTCLNDFNKGDKQIASTHVTRKKRVTSMDPCETSTNNTLTNVKQQTMNNTNEHVIPFTGVKGATATSGSKPMSNTKKDRTFPAKIDMKKVEVHPRNNDSSVKRKNHVDSSISYKRTVFIKLLLLVIIMKKTLSYNFKKGLGYNAVPPPHTGLFPPPKSDLSSTGLEELFNEPKTEKSKDKSNEVEPESVRKNSNSPIIEDYVSDDEVEEVKKHEVKPSINRINFIKSTTDNIPKGIVKTGEQPKKHSQKKRPNKKLTAVKNSYANKKVKTVWVKKVNTAKPKATVNAAKAKAKYNAVKGKRGNDVKASLCWGNPHEYLQDKGVIDSGCSRHMTWNMSFLTDYKEIDRGYVAFGGNPKRRKDYKQR